MEWQTMDSAPKDGSDVLGYGEESIRVMWWDRPAGWIVSWHEYGGPETWQPTHWQPLPEPPK